MSIYKPDREQIVELEFSSKKHKKSKIKKFINRTYGPVEKSVYHKEGRAFLVCKNSEAANHIVKGLSVKKDYTGSAFQNEITAKPHILKSNPMYTSMKNTKTKKKIKPKKLTKILKKNKWKIISCLQDETEKELYYVTYLSTEAETTDVNKKLQQLKLPKNFIWVRSNEDPLAKKAEIPSGKSAATEKVESNRAAIANSSSQQKANEQGGDVVNNQNLPLKRGNPNQQSIAQSNAAAKESEGHDYRSSTFINPPTKIYGSAGHDNHHSSTTYEEIVKADQELKDISSKKQELSLHNQPSLINSDVDAEANRVQEIQTLEKSENHQTSEDYKAFPDKKKIEKANSRPHSSESKRNSARTNIEPTLEFNESDQRSMEKKVEKEKNKKKKEKKGKQEKKERQLLESETSADQMQITTLSKSLSHQSETEKLDKRLFFENNSATRNNDDATTERASQNQSLKKPEFHLTSMAYQYISPAGKEIEIANDSSLTNEDSRNNNQSSTTNRDAGIEKKMEHAQLPEGQPTVTDVMEKNLSLDNNTTAKNNDVATTERALQNQSSNKPEFHHTPMAYQDISPTGKENEMASDSSLTKECSENNNRSLTTSRDGSNGKKIEHLQLPEGQPIVTEVKETNLQLDKPQFKRKDVALDSIEIKIIQHSPRSNTCKDYKISKHTEQSQQLSEKYQPSTASRNELDKRKEEKEDRTIIEKDNLVMQEPATFFEPVRRQTAPEKVETTPSPEKSIAPKPSTIIKPSEKRKRELISVENKAQETPAFEKAPQNNAITLQPTDEKFIEVEKAFLQTVNVASVRVEKIELIKNETLKAIYEAMREDIVNEMRLWHGTNVSRTTLGLVPIVNINARGFNRGYCGQSTGAVYGDGVYFATSASTSMKYCKPFEGLCYMYYCRVLVGDYTTGRAGIKEPPIKDIDTQEWFDSVVDNEESPSMFVIFNDTQVYPEYLLTFSNDPHDI